MKAKMLTSEGKIVTGTVINDLDLQYRDQLISELTAAFPYQGDGSITKAATAIVCRWEMKPRDRPYDQFYDGPQQIECKAEERTAENVYDPVA